MADTTPEQLLILGTAIAIGTFAIGKAAVDHYFASRGPVNAVDWEEFEEQHYRAVGMIRAGEASPSALLDDLVAFSATIAGICVMIAGVPKVIDDLSKELSKL